MTRKRILILLGSLTLAVMLVVMACAGPAPTPPTTPAPTTSAPTTPAPAPAPEVIKWKYQSHRIASEFGHWYYKELIEDIIPAMTNGRLEIEYFWAGEVVTTGELFDAVSRGALEIITSPPYWTGILPEASIEGGLPYSFRDSMELYHFYYGKEEPGFWRGWRFIDLLRGIYAEHNIYYLSATDSWPASFMFAEPFETLDDLQGRSVRAPGVRAEWWSRIGLVPIPTPAEELHTALATGVLDGVGWGSGMGHYTMGFYETCKYMLMPVLIQHNPTPTIVNMDAWNALPDDIKLMLEPAFIKAGFDMTFLQNQIGEKWAIDKMVEEYGVTVVELNEADLERAMEAAWDVWDGLSKISPKGAEMVQLMTEYMEFRGYR